MELKPDEVSTENSLFSKVFILTSCVLAIIFFLATLLLLLAFRGFPTDYSTIHKHLCSCLILAEIVFLCGADQVDTACAILAGALHFLLQAVFVWLFLSAFQLYLLLTEPTHSNRICCYSVVAYGMPALIVGVSAVVDPKSYGTPNYCFIRFDNYYIFSFVGPAISCILGAVMFLILTICKTHSSSVAKDKELAKINTIRIQNRETWFIVLSSGSSWAFLLWYMKQRIAVLSYLFATLNCLQGLAVFIFFGLNNSEVQQAYRKWKMRSCAKSKNTRSQFPLQTTCSPHSIEAPYLQPSTTVSSLSTVTTPELEFQLGTFHHSELCHTTRSPIYDNREQLVS
ncbi:Latrophilin-3, partial [Stegodyphus mimosarum]